MARRSEGWRLYHDARRDTYYVRFTLSGQRYTLGTGEADIGRAQRAAAQIYEQAISGKHTPARRARGVVALDALLAEWIAAVESEVSSEMAETYQRYAFGLYEPYFRRIDLITTVGCSDYVRTRLKQVQAVTVRKELSGLRRFVAWLEECGYLEQAPAIKPVPKAARGVEAEGGLRRKVRVDLTVAQVERIIAAMPAVGKYGHDLKAFFTVLWETGLRRGTLWRLERPKHHRRGVAELRLTADIDKSRYERVLPLSPRAAEALDSAGPDKGLIFPPSDFRASLRVAAAKAGLPPDQARHVSYHDFRHARLTHWASVTTDLAGMAYLAGHKHVSTTSLYVHAQKQAAEALVQRPQGKRRKVRE
jgi:integrase